MLFSLTLAPLNAESQADQAANAEAVPDATPAQAVAPVSLQSLLGQKIDAPLLTISGFSVLTETAKATAPIAMPPLTGVAIAEAPSAALAPSTEVSVDEYAATELVPAGESDKAAPIVPAVIVAPAAPPALLPEPAVPPIEEASVTTFDAPMSLRLAPRSSSDEAERADRESPLDGSVGPDANATPALPASDPQPVIALVTNAKAPDSNPATGVSLATRDDTTAKTPTRAISPGVSWIRARQTVPEAVPLDSLAFTGRATLRTVESEPAMTKPADLEPSIDGSIPEGTQLANPRPAAPVSSRQPQFSEIFTGREAVAEVAPKPAPAIPADLAGFVVERMSTTGESDALTNGKVKEFRVGREANREAFTPPAIEGKSSGSAGEIERVEAPVKIAADLPEKPAAAAAVRDITLRLGDTENGRIDLKIHERAGALEFSVRTDDAGVAASLRRDLRGLVDGLDRSGISAETWIPSQRTSESSGSTSDQHQETQPGDQRGGSGQHSQPKRDQRERTHDGAASPFAQGLRFETEMNYEEGKIR